MFYPQGTIFFEGQLPQFFYPQEIPFILMGEASAMFYTHEFFGGREANAFVVPQEIIFFEGGRYRHVFFFRRRTYFFEGDGVAMFLYTGKHSFYIFLTGQVPPFLLSP